MVALQMLIFTADVTLPPALTEGGEGGLWLLISLFVCHYLADYCLTTPAMIRAKTDGRTLAPIMAHAAVHAVLMGCCLWVFGTDFTRSALLAGVELLSHFVIDTAKGRITARFPLLADNKQKPFWMLNGFDQLLHILVIIGIWYAA